MKHLLPKLGIVKFAFSKWLLTRNVREHEEKGAIKRNQNVFVANILFFKEYCKQGLHLLSLSGQIDFLKCAEISRFHYISKDTLREETIAKEIFSE